MILVTAFKPFNNRGINASEEVLKRLSLNENYIKAFLTVSKDESVKELKELVNKYKPTKIISLGESGKDDKIVIEHKTHNLMNFSIKDENGFEIKNEIIDKNYGIDLENESFPYILYNINILNKYIIEGFDPGYFICNLIYFNSLKINRNNLFIHLPLIENNISDGYKKMDLDLMVNVVSEIIKEVSK